MREKTNISTDQLIDNEQFNLELPITDSRSTGNNYTYHNYFTLMQGLTDLNSAFGNLIDVFTAQEEYGLADCGGGYKIPIARITNESRVFNKHNK